MLLREHGVSFAEEVSWLNCKCSDYNFFRNKGWNHSSYAFKDKFAIPIKAKVDPGQDPIKYFQPQFYDGIETTCLAVTSHLTIFNQ